MTHEDETGTANLIARLEGGSGSIRLRRGAGAMLVTRQLQDYSNVIHLLEQTMKDQTVLLAGVDPGSERLSMIDSAIR